MADMKVFICIIVGTVAGIFFLKKQRRNYFGLGYYAKGRGESKHADEEEEEGEEEESGRANMGIQSIGDMGPSGSGSICLTDPDVLDCPICLELLISPVYQVLWFFLSLIKMFIVYFWWFWLWIARRGEERKRKKIPIQMTSRCEYGRMRSFETKKFECCYQNNSVEDLLLRICL